MAKLKAPLMSLGASGALGKALVFFGWKGLDVVREYVIPSNPKTDPQNIQRGYLRAAVLRIHQNQAKDLLPLDEEDIMAYALWGSTFPTPRTWFNQAVKNMLEQQIAGYGYTVYRTGHCTCTSGQVKFNIRNDYFHTSHIKTGNVHYGTSKTALNKVKLATPDLPTNEMVATIDGLTNGVKYYFQFRPLTIADYVKNWSGIYYGTPKA